MGFRKIDSHRWISMENRFSSMGIHGISTRGATGPSPKNIQGIREWIKCLNSFEKVSLFAHITLKVLPGNRNYRYPTQVHLESKWGKMRILSFLQWFRKDPETVFQKCVNSTAELETSRYCDQYMSTCNVEPKHAQQTTWPKPTKMPHGTNPQNSKVTSEKSLKFDNFDPRKISFCGLKRSYRFIIHSSVIHIVRHDVHSDWSQFCFGMTSQRINMISQIWKLQRADHLKKARRNQSVRSPQKTWALSKLWSSHHCSNFLKIC